MHNTMVAKGEMFLQRCRRSCFSNNSVLFTLGEMRHGPQPCACLLPALLPLLPVLLLRNPLYGPLPSKVNCSRLGCLTIRFVALRPMRHVPLCTDGCSMQKQ